MFLSLGNLVSGILSNMPYVNTGLSILGGARSLYNMMRGSQPLNTYSTEVNQDMERSFNTLAQHSKGVNEEMGMRASDPINSKLGQSLLAQHQTNINKSLASQLMSGQASSYDVRALQDRGNQQGIQNITSQLSGISSQASQQYFGNKMAYGGASPSQLVPIFNQGSNAMASAG